MTVAELRAKLRLAKRYGSGELHLSAAEYAAARQAARDETGKAPARDPQRYAEHFLFEGGRVVKTWEGA